MQRLYAKPLISSSISVNMSIVGMNGSGKSALLVKYLTRRFIVEYAPYLSDSYTKTDCIDGQEITLNIQDTSDSDDMDMDDIIKWSQAIIVLFSITSRRSFYRAQELIETLKQTCNISSRASTLSPQRQSLHNSPISGSSAATSPLSPIGPGHTGSLRRSALYGSSITRPPTIILVANKSDLDRFRLVEKMEAEEFAKRYGIPYYETTAAETYQEVQSIFHSVVRLSSGGRLLKSRGPNGSGTFASRQLASSTSSLGSTTGSVLSSLAVSPGLLLQKKTISPSSTTASTPTEPGACGSGAETDQPSSGPVSKLTNLRFRAASPPTFTKNFRSPSPGWTVGRSSNDSGLQATPGQTMAAPTITSTHPSQSASTSMTNMFSSGSAAATTPSSEQPTRATTPSGLNRVSLTSQLLRAVQPSTTEDNSTSNRVSNSPGQTSSTGSINNTSQVSGTQPPPVPPKKSPMSFRFFSKKSK